MRVVVQHKHPVSGLDERGAGIDAVELRDLIEESVDFEEADPFVAADIALVAPADVVGAEAAVPVGGFMQHASLREQQPVAEVLVALPARRVARRRCSHDPRAGTCSTWARTGSSCLRPPDRASQPAARPDLDGGGLVCDVGGV